MAHTTFDQDIFIAASLGIVRKQLAQLMTNVAEMHPFVVWARRTQTTTAPDGAAVEHYLVRDRMKLGLFTIAFTYKVDMAVTATGQLVSNAYQAPGIHLYNHTWCEPEGQGTRVREHIEITAPRMLLKTTYKGAAIAHEELFAKLKQRIEQAPVSL